MRPTIKLLIRSLNQLSVYFLSLILGIFMSSAWASELSSDELILELNKRIESEDFKSINGIVAFKGHKLVLEQYYGYTTSNDLHNPRSVGKTFASAMIGIALRDGYLDSLDQTLGEFYDLKRYKNYSVSKEKVTIRQLLTMSSGFEGFDFDPDSLGNEENMYPTENWVEWALNLPMAEERNPGEQWFYFTGGAVLVGDILHKLLPGGLEAYAQKELFEPLGIKKLQWQYTPQGVANTAGGLQLSARNFAKFGQLYSNNGLWKGKKVLDQSFVEQSCEAVYQTSVGGNQYGLLWWIKEYQVDERKISVCYASGNGGNKIFVLQNHPIVVAITASAYGRPYGHSQVDEIMQTYILPTLLKEVGAN